MRNDRDQPDSGDARALEARSRIARLVGGGGVLLPVAAALLAIGVLSPAIPGGWVYDDRLKILDNNLVRDPALFWEALVSDEWAFLSAGGESASPYWRPTFVLWMIANQRLLGLADPGAWRLECVLLHALVTLLAYGVCRRLGLSWLPAGIVACLFAVHPSRVETAGWASGATDLLLATGMLGSLWLILPALQGAAWSRARTLLAWSGSLLLYAAACGAKEAAVLFPLVIFAASLRWRQPDEPLARPRLDVASWRRAALMTLPFVGVAALYLLIRAVVLRSPDAVPVQGTDLLTVLLTLPQVGAFYLRQALFPAWIGPVYPLSPVVSPGFWSVAVPLAIVTIAAIIILWLVLRTRCRHAALVGLAIFVLPLAPACNIGAFAPEQMVHDRYLYVPLLGLATLLVLGASELLRRARWSQGARDAVLASGAAVACILLAVQTLRYAPAWTADLTIWEWGARSDPTSALAHSQHGLFLMEADRLDEARAELAESLRLSDTDGARLGLAETSLRRAQPIEDEAAARPLYDEAEGHLRIALSRQGASPDITLFHASDLLARVLLERDDNVDAAITLYRHARDRLPAAAAAITDRIAMVLTTAGRSEEAVRELESVRDRAMTEALPQARLVYWRLGELYAASGRPRDAQLAFQEFLRATAGAHEPGLIQLRESAARRLAAMQGR
jgi:tetratricopeptide (TPR) repeat protein